MIWPRVALRDAPDWLSSSSSVSATGLAAGSSLILFVIYLLSEKTTGWVFVAPVRSVAVDTCMTRGMDEKDYYPISPSKSTCAFSN